MRRCVSFHAITDTINCMYKVMVTFHVLTTVFLIGPMAILPMIGLRSLRAGDSASVARSARSTLIFSVASLLALLFGFAVQGMSTWEKKPSLDDPWIFLSIIFYFVALALSLVAIVPAMRSAAERLADTSETGIRPNEYRRIAIASGLVTLLLVAVVVLMVVKP